MTNKISGLGLEHYTYLTGHGEPIRLTNTREIPAAEDRLIAHEEPASSCNIVEIFESVLTWVSSLLKNLFLSLCGKSSDTYCQAMAERARADFLATYPALEEQGWQGILTAVAIKPQEFGYATLGLSESREGSLDRQASARRAIHRHILSRAAEGHKGLLEYVYWGKSGLLHALFEVVSLANLGHENLNVTVVGNDANEFALLKGILQQFAAEKEIVINIHQIAVASDYKGTADLISIPEGQNPEEALSLQDRLKAESGRLVFGHDEAIALIDNEKVLSETDYKKISFGLYGALTTV